MHVTKLEETEAVLSGSKLAFDVAIVAVGAKTKRDGLARGFEDNGNDGTIQGHLAHLKTEGEIFWLRNLFLSLEAA